MIFLRRGRWLGSGLVLLAALAGGCSSNPAQSKTLPLPKATAAVTGLLGSWASAKDDGRITFSADGKFRLAWPSKNRAVTGAWTAADNVLTLVDDPGADGCGDEKGQYVFQIRGDLVIFSVLADGCEVRREHLQLPWARLAAS